MADAFLAVDWGTTNRRVYHIEKGRVIATMRDDLGARAMRPGDYPAELDAIRARFGDMPMLLAGMVGSSIGWHEVTYVELPAGLDTLGTALHKIDGRTAIVPGIAQAQPADVMRGEEVQLLGAAAAGMVPRDALLCQPGTHCKWVRLKDAKITQFFTAMTGELFGLLRAHSILSTQLHGDVTDGPAFRSGVLQSTDEGLQTELFRVRARALLGRESDAASFTSGLLIGEDVRRRIDGAPVHILADHSLGGLYRAAIETLGGTAIIVESHAAFVAGVTRIREVSR